MILCWPDLAESILAFLLWFCSWCCLQFIFEFCMLFLVVLLMIAVVSFEIQFKRFEEKRFFHFRKACVFWKKVSLISIRHLVSQLFFDNGCCRIKWEALCLKSIAKEQYSVCGSIFPTWFRTSISDIHRCAKYRNFTYFPTRCGSFVETQQKLCVSTKFSFQEITWNYGILCNALC